ncbi:MAG: MaoC family dehydratase N-terminal domain-containing protein [Rhodospirillales bacterium]|nr:MaoC family dehydratase N-terminal domain-containing protein [Rhodospirillales bacterium]
MTTLDIEILKTWIGRSESHSDVISLKPVQMMAATLGRTVDTPKDGDPLPAAWHWLYFLGAKPRGDLGRDGHAALGEFLPPVALPRRMWAGGCFDFQKPIHIGETIKKVSTINKVERKSGRSGELCFVTVRHQLFAGDEMRITDDHNIVYREDPTSKEPAPPTPAPTNAKIRETITPDPVLLFRYSALTFNSHRIHYDVDYCRDVEGYPGLVFHGPLTATLLLDLAMRNMEGRTFTGFSYRAVAPLFDTSPFTIALAHEEDGMILWAETPEGNLAMSATVSIRERH